MAGFDETFRGRLDTCGVIVRRLAAAENQVAVVISGGGNDGGDTGLCYAKEAVRMVRGADRVRRDLDIAIRPVLETDRAGQTGGEFAVHLALGRPGTDCTPADEVRDVLRGNHIEELNADRESHLRDIRDQSPGHAEAVVDAEGSIQIRVVDKAFPADRGAGLLEVDTHDDFKVPRETAAFCDESLRILTGRFRVMDRAGADNDEKAVIFAVDNPMGGRSGTLHRG